MTFTTNDNIATYQSENELPFPILLDPDRAAYRSYGLDRGSLARVWGPKAALRYFQIVRTQGRRRIHVPTEDTRQLGGDFVINADGNLAYGFWGKGPDDRPSVDELVQAVSDARHTP